MFLYTRQNSRVALYYIWRVGDSEIEHRSEDGYIPYLDTYTRSFPLLGKQKKRKKEKKSTYIHKKHHLNLLHPRQTPTPFQMHQLRIDPEVIIRVAADNFPRGKSVKVIENFCGDGRMDGQKGQGGRSIVDGIDACGRNGSEVGFCGQEEAVDVLAELEGEAEEVAAGLMGLMMMGLVGLMLIWGIWRSHYRYVVLDVVFTLDVYTPHVHVPGDRVCGNLEGVNGRKVTLISCSAARTPLFPKTEVQYRISLAY